MKKLIVLLAVSILVIITAVFFVINLNKKPSSETTTREVTFVFDNINGAEVTLHHNKNQSSLDGEIGDKIADVSPNSTHRLPGDKNYIVKVAGDGVKSYQSIVYLNGKTNKHQLYISRTTDFLNSVKQSEGGDIINSAKNQLQKWFSHYTLAENSLKVLDDGTWAVLKLTYKGSVVLQRDSLFVVLHKESSNWQVVAGPELVISKIDHPNIPNVVILEAAPTEPPAK